MHQEKYKLNWHTYSDHLREMLHEMMKSNELTDVTLISDDKKQFKAHKIVLSACSSVFKSIISDLSQKSSVIYLRGIKHQEMKSILEFMYLGVASFYQERMNDFLNVAKNLEIKEISKDVEFDDGNEPTEETEISDNDSDQVSEPQQTDTNLIEYEISAKNTNIISESQLQNNTKGMFEFNQFTLQRSFRRHNESTHEGVKYSCNQCDKQFTQRNNLTVHIQTIHEGVTHDCNQCDYQARGQSNLLNHIKKMHLQIK